MPRIIVIIDKNGNSSVKAEGFKGDLCFKATKEIEAALGQIESTKRSQEYYEPVEEMIKTQEKINDEE